MKRLGNNSSYYILDGEPILLELVYSSEEDMTIHRDFLITLHRMCLLVGDEQPPIAWRPI